MIDHHFEIARPGKAPICGVLTVDPTVTAIIAVNGRGLRLGWSDRWGPYLADQHGDPAKREPGPNHEFWRAASLWNRQGKRIENGTAIWHEPAPEIIEVRGRMIVNVVQIAEDPDYSKTIVRKLAP